MNGPISIVFVAQFLRIATFLLGVNGTLAEFKKCDYDFNFCYSSSKENLK